MSSTPPNAGTSSNFRFSARNVFLTYSTIERFTTASPGAFRDAVIALLLGLGCQHYCVAIELHRNGEHHVHACAKFSRKLDSRSADVFDVFGVHPNIQSARCYSAVLAYCKKDANFVEETVQQSESLPSLAINHFDLAREFDSFEAWVNYCIDMKIPYGYCDRIWKEIKNISVCTISEHDIIVGSMSQSLETLSLHTSKSIVLVGSPGCGKTTWAKINAPKPALFVTHFDVLREFKDHKCIIFDDMDFKHLPRTSQIHLVDMENTRAVHRRYGITIVPAGTLKIFTANEFPFIEDPAIQRRINTFIIH